MNKKMTSPSRVSKTTNEKPVSLFPLNFNEAVAAFLKVKPEEEKVEKKEQKTERKN